MRDTLPAPAVAIESAGVFVTGLRIAAEIGLYPHERGRTQPLVIDVELALDPRPPHHLRDTFNYEDVARAAEAIVAEGHVELVETFAHRLALACMAHPLVNRARVRVAKPEALSAADAAGAEIVLKRA